MFYYLHELGMQNELLSFLRLFSFVTFRAGCAAFTAFGLTLALGPLTVRLLHRVQAVAPDRHAGLIAAKHIDERKKKVPSMGGLLILFSVLLSMLLWAIPTNGLVLVFMGLMLALGAVGFVDDFRKIRGRSRDGISGKAKLFWQIVIAMVAVYLLSIVPETGDNVRKLMVPFLKNPLLENMSIMLAIGFGTLVVIGASNAVNLTDGMDGLAIGCTITTALTYAIFAYATGHAKIAGYLNIPFILGSSEVAVIASAMAGAGLGFLWFNCYPASMFMGDTGSLSLGGAIGLIAVLVKQELVLVIVGGIFVMEAGSVLLQVGWFKFTRRCTGEPRRLFLCAPYHLHLKMKGWTETQIVMRLWILSIILAGIGLATLKIR